MSQAAIQLQCPNCGAQLSITAELETFACAYCSTTILVRREGGTVSLERMERTLNRVHDNTEKAAAELAIARYEKELAVAEGLHQRLQNENFTDIGRGFGLGGLLVVVGLVVLSMTFAESVLGWAVLVAGLYGLARGWAALRSTAAERLVPQIRDLKSKIAERKKIADG